MNPRQNIKVMPDTLNNLIVAVSKGAYRIPQFQREYVWEKSKVIELFDSIYKEYPIGSFFLWRADREHNRLFRHSIDLDVPEIEDGDNVSFILDGQQRITSLYVTLMGMTARGIDYSRICFDVKDEKFTHRAPDNSRYIRVCDIWGDKALEVADGVDKMYKPAFVRCFTILKTYPVSLVEVSDKDLPAVCNIFQRINQAGKRLDRFDMISAMTFSPDFDLREKFKQDVLAPLNEKSFGAISPSIVTQLMALIKKGACTELAEYSLSSEDIKEIWKPVVDSVLIAAETLRNSFGVQNADYLPYDAILTLLSYFFTRSGQRSLTAEQLAWVQHWFWRASFSQHYGSGGATKIGRDREMFDRLAIGDYPPFEPAMNLTAEVLVGTKMTWTRSAVRNAFLCLLAYEGPVHLGNNSRLDLINGSISGFTSSEKHHIFPQGFLRAYGTGENEIHSIPNFCFMPADLNKRILDSRPSDYFADLRQSNSKFEDAARTHLIPLGKNSGIEEDDYLQFLKARSDLILQEIERLTGLSTVPPENERHKAVELLEIRIRDLVHATLVELHGPQYWKVGIPEDVRTEAEKRIETDLRKNPDCLPDHYADPRHKLDFCNLTDYTKIVMMKNHWPSFQPIFSRPKDFERHMEAFSVFRNALAHYHPLTEFKVKAGELAILWLHSTMSNRDPTEINSEAAEDNE